MRSRRFSQVDVFSPVVYGGNPLAVVHDAEDLDTETMQRFARWTNLSETTFLLPPQDSTADYRVRIFTPTQELPFAGHPTLGSCHAWLEAGGSPRQPEVIVQECDAGLVPLRRTEAGLAFGAPPLRRTGPVDEALLTRIAGTLRLDRAAIVDASWLVNGPEWIGLLLDGAEAVLAVRPGSVEADVGIVGLYPADAPESIEVRAFFPVGGSTAEDPVTGSLNAALAQWLLGSGRLSAPYVARQGTALQRSGRVHITTDDGEIWVGGRTITCVEGSVEL
jgi:PhzF family phenazine biosynthesis protein